MPERRVQERRLAFGRVAQLYEHARPSYPAQAFDDLIDFASLRAGERVLEVGAGTGKAIEMRYVTRLCLARRT